MLITDTMLANLPGDPGTGLNRADSLWSQYRQGDPSCPTVVTRQPGKLTTVDWDVVICGGTLGIMLAAALVQGPWRVVLLERGILKGREQEWNISRQIGRAHV